MLIDAFCFHAQEQTRKRALSFPISLYRIARLSRLGIPAASLPSRRARRSRKEKAWPKLEKDLGPMALCIDGFPLVAPAGCNPGPNHEIRFAERQAIFRNKYVTKFGFVKFGAKTQSWQNLANRRAGTLSK